MSNARFQILQEIIRTLQSDCTFTPEPGDDLQGVKPQNIVFQKVSVAERDVNKGQTLYNFPLLIVSCPRAEPFNPGEGEVQHDVYHYRFLVQIVDADQLEPTSNLNTYWTWQETVARTFAFKTTWDNVNAEQVLCVPALVDTIDERYWILDEKFKAGVELDVQAWMSRLGKQYTT